MSIYDAMSIPVPLIAYSVLHQMRKGVGENEYTKTIQDLHDLLHSESIRVAEALQNHLHDITASSIQTTRGNLSQFLTLPLDSDVKEIQRILDDQITHVLGQALPASKIGVVTSTEGRLIWEREQNVALQSMLTRGKDQLKKLKFRTKDEDQLIFESDYLLEGGLNLDIIEHIVRDRIGTYGPTHGHHTQQADTFVYAAHNIVYLHGALETGESRYEAVTHFVKGKVQYEPFRKGLRELLTSIEKEQDLPHCSLRQRKLGLGAGTEFNIRFRARDRKTVRESLLSFARGAEKNPMYASIVKNGHVFLKELIR